MSNLADHMPTSWDADAAYEGFANWVVQVRGHALYPAQEEAIIALASGANLILATPTGSGKSLVAVAAHAFALAQGQRSYYTAPIKALVSEKFFQLVDIFGAKSVGMVTGEGSVNGDAAIICCTAEILANLALRQGADLLVDVVVMDEFHFYADPDRGWAWQVPLLELNRAQFLLMSATLGDTDTLAADLSRRTGRETEQVTGVARPVPLEFGYSRETAPDTLHELMEAGRTPVYIVHFAQAAALEQAQGLAGMGVASREQRDAIAETIAGFRFTTAFGRTLSRLVRLGIGVHHAGMLPRYRRLVETLAQRGLLPVICGTDTLGVGINVPIRSVILTALSKYDGNRMRRLTAREFHQIAGRAGRAGFDTEGDVVVLAPEHEILNGIALKKAGDDPKKLKKVAKKKPPAGFVSWSEDTLDRLVASPPEPLRPQMRLTAAMLVNVIARGGDVLAHVRHLIFDNHQTRAQQYQLALRALAIYRTLSAAGIVVVTPAPDLGPDRSSVHLTVDLQANFALNQPLSPFALAALGLLDPDSPTFALDVVSVIESTLDDPRVVLAQQQFAARGEAVAAMKQEGIEYDERMELLEEVTWPKPLAELLEQAYDDFARGQPWVRDFELSPKSVVRDMFERAMSFTEFVSHYQLSRSEGVVLRYLSEAHRALRQTVPDELKDDELHDIIEWLGALITQVDSSLEDEWSMLTQQSDENAVGTQSGTTAAASAAANARTAGPGATSATDSGIDEVRPPQAASIVANRRAFTILVRNELFRRVQLAALERDDTLSDLDPELGWSAVLDAYYREYDSLGTGPAARSAALVIIDDNQSAHPGTWLVTQILDDPNGDHDWRIQAEVDLATSNESGEAALKVLSVGKM